MQTNKPNEPNGPKSERTYFCSVLQTERSIFGRLLYIKVDVGKAKFLIVYINFNVIEATD